MRTLSNPDRNTWKDLCRRPTDSLDALEPRVRDIFRDVEKVGDSAIKKYTRAFDGVHLDELQVSRAEITKAALQIPKNLKEAIQQAKKNIDAFHRAQQTGKVSLETQEGVLCWQEMRPIEKVGLYIPGGSAPLFSTVLMLAIPAQIAGCKEVVVCTPPDKNGAVPTAILYAADLCGVTRIIKVGGIQAIAGLTFGTETIPSVYKIFGPGNQYVTAAKQFATRHGVAIDLPAGPSELMVAADRTADADFIAADLLSQAEHGPDSQVVLLSNSEDLLKSVSVKLKSQIKNLPRKAIAEKSLENSISIYFDQEYDILEFINAYAPEHLIISMEREEFFTEGIMNAGSVFLGNYSPESAGDYASGTNHTLPTGGYARQYGSVNLGSFMKLITFQKLSQKGLQNLGPTIEVMAEAEDLLAHKNAVSIRLKKINS